MSVDIQQWWKMQTKMLQAWYVSIATHTIVHWNSSLEKSVSFILDASAFLCSRIFCSKSWVLRCNKCAETLEIQRRNKWIGKFLKIVIFRRNVFGVEEWLQIEWRRFQRAFHPHGKFLHWKYSQTCTYFIYNNTFRTQVTRFNGKNCHPVVMTCANLPRSFAEKKKGAITVGFIPILEGKLK